MVVLCYWAVCRCCGDVDIRRMHAEQKLCMSDVASPNSRCPVKLESRPQLHSLVLEQQYNVLPGVLSDHEYLPEIVSMCQ